MPIPPEVLFHRYFQVENAMAFFYEGYSFIGITIAFVRALYPLCSRLGESAEVVATPSACRPPTGRGTL